MARRGAPPDDVVVNYEHLPIRCGKARCRCSHTTDQSQWHGPYWYAYWNDPRTGRKRSHYVGKHFTPPSTRRTVHSERRAPPEQEARRRSRARREAPPPPPPQSHGQNERDAALLGVSVDASHTDARRAWRRLAAEHHPDRVPEPRRKAQEEIAKKINAAWERFKRRRGWH